MHAAEEILRRIRVRQEVSHSCHAKGCEAVIPPRLFMCSRHWHLLHYALRRQIYKHYTPGQEVTKTPTREYLDVALAAIDYVAEKEGLQ